MKLFKRKEKETKALGSFQLIKGALFAVFISLICVLIFAFIIKFAGLSTGLIKPVNQGIKIGSILLGCLYAFKSNKSQGFFKGIVIGLFYVIFSFIVFSALDRNFKLGLNILNDALFGSIAGAICGIIAVNLGGRGYKKINN